VPLLESMQKAYEPTVKVTKTVKGAIGLLYSMYATTFYMTLLLPRFSIISGVRNTSRKMTIGFSNTPGPLKTLTYINPKTKETSRAGATRTYLMIAGELGLAFGAVSCPGSIVLTTQSDESVLSQEENKQLISLAYDNIMSEIKRVQELKETKKD